MRHRFTEIKNKPNPTAVSCKMFKKIKKWQEKYAAFHVVVEFAYKDKFKKNTQFKTVFNGDTAYITQLKQQKLKRCYHFCSTSP